MIPHGQVQLSGGEAVVDVEAGGRAYIITGLTIDADENVYWTEKAGDIFKVKSSNGASEATVGWRVRPSGIRLRPATITLVPRLVRAIVLNSPLIAVTRRFAIVGIAIDTRERRQRTTAEELIVEPIVVTTEE